MGWMQGTAQACAVAACMTIAVMGVLLGFALRARLERGIRREYRELFSVCRRSMQGASEYGTAAPVSASGTGAVVPSQTTALARRDRPIPLPAALLQKRAERLKTTEYVPDQAAAARGRRVVRELNVVRPPLQMTRPPHLPTKTHSMAKQACEELVLTGGLLEGQRDA